MRTGTSCIVEQLGLATIPSCQARSSGLTWLTTSGTAGSIRQALELSMTVAPRPAAARAETVQTSPPAPHPRPPGGAAGGGQPPPPQGEAPLGEDLDHGPPDDAGGADDGDREGRSVAHPGMAPQGFLIRRAPPEYISDILG